MRCRALLFFALTWTGCRAPKPQAITTADTARTHQKTLEEASSRPPQSDSSDADLIFPGAAVTALEPAPGGVYAGRVDGTLERIAGDSLLFSLRLTSHPTAFLACGATLFVGARNRTLALDAVRGSVLWENSQDVVGAVVALAEGKPGSLLVADAGTSILELDRGSGEALGHFGPRLAPASLRDMSASGQKVAVALHSGELLVFDLSGEVVWQTVSEGGTPMRWARFSGDGLYAFGLDLHLFSGPRMTEETLARVGFASPLAASGGRVFFCDRVGDVLEAGNPDFQWKCGAVPSALAWDGQRLWVGDREGRLRGRELSVNR